MSSTRVEDNLGLVKDYVLKHFHKDKSIPLEESDEYADAVDGLLRAHSGYTTAKGAFSTYATYCIRNAIIDGLRSRKRKLVKMSYLGDNDIFIPSSDKQADQKTLLESLFADKANDSDVNRRDKEMLKLKHFQNLSASEIAEKYGMTRAGVHLGLKRAVDKLRVEHEMELKEIA